MSKSLSSFKAGESSSEMRRTLRFSEKLLAALPAPIFLNEGWIKYYVHISAPGARRNAPSVKSLRPGRGGGRGKPLSGLALAAPIVAVRFRHSLFEIVHKFFAGAELFVWIRASLIRRHGGTDCYATGAPRRAANLLLIPTIMF